MADPRNAIKFVNFTETKSRMTALASSLINCDSGAYTSAAIVTKIKSGTLSYQDLYAYAGYATRTKLVRGCMAVDSTPGSPTAGQKVACMDDVWWGPATYDPDNGACHTFNPCHGFPVGAVCDHDSDCQHYADPTLTGGTCQAGLCACSRCVAGKDCRLATQLNPGRGRGIRILANVGTDQDPTFAAASNARWVDGLLVHLHTQHDAGNLGAGFSVSPGSSTDVAVEQDGYDDEQYPFTNCSMWINTDAAVCQSNCLRRMQAINCCGLDVPAVVKGKAGVVSSHDPGIGVVNATNPVLLCNVLSPAVAGCFGDEASKVATSLEVNSVLGWGSRGQVSDGLACLEGSQGFTSPYYGGIWLRTNWYDDQDATSSAQVSAQEQKSLAIQKQCVWGSNDGNLQEARYGKACSSNSDCATSTGGSGGVCVPAFRAYCPSKCSYYQYRVVSINSAALSVPTVQIISAEELAQTTAYYKIVPNAQRRWKPRCGDGAGDSTGACFTDTMAQQLVATNYALVNIDFVNFDETLSQAVSGISIASLMGTVGGNLGMFVGMSVMTILEWLELLFFAIVAMPFFFLGIRAGPFVRNADQQEDEGGEEVDADVKQVLRNISAIAANRQDGATAAKYDSKADAGAAKAAGTPSAPAIVADLALDGRGNGRSASK